MTTIRNLHTLPELAGMLAARIEALVLEVLPAGRRDGSEWRVGSLAGEPGRSLAVHLGKGPKRGVWCDFASGEAGDALDLVAFARCGGDRAEAVRWARAWLGLTAGEGRMAPRPAVAPAPSPAAEIERPDRAGRALWLSGTPIQDTPAAAYLAGRGLALAALARVPGALRYREDAWCSERGRGAPAMLACIVSGSEIIGCHRTFLARRPDGSWGKAAVRAPKKVLGQVRGGAIPIARGRNNTPLASAGGDETVAVTEGIEDALTVALHMPEWRVLAAVSLGNMAELVLPQSVSRLVLVFDRDGENPAARRGRDRAVAAHQRAGREVRIVLPPEGYKDVNEWWRADAQQRRPNTGQNSGAA
jgi:hypothetical protein